ncbi:hypothetical protein CRE_18372 [Caenorhabditis remanei]|uniref:Serpentine receptor class gamma n=1 Tax=Caenorhabditis remanei TaxID=31234 RepID=E3NUF7_CAERE|nr:hypothetical protein CRE_18372 [Caenorhabditis remanei]
MVKKAYFLFLYLVVSFILFFVLAFNDSPYVLLALLTSCLTCFALYIIVQVFHLLISLLAVQRLVIYFVPSMEKSTFFFLNAFLVTSALLYIPITLSIWKLTSLTMNQDKPQKYIFFQTVVILIFKSACVPAVLAFILLECSINYSIGFVASMDIIIIPLIIQMSYLGCNKRNINTLFHSFNLTRFVRVLLDFEVETTVEPQITLTHFSSTRHSTRQ